jgi:hypothetical protein
MLGDEVMPFPAPLYGPCCASGKTIQGQTKARPLRMIDASRNHMTGVRQMALF